MGEILSRSDIIWQRRLLRLTVLKKMKVFIVLCVVVATAFAFKNELKVKDCGNPMVSVVRVEDNHGGALDKDSKLAITFSNKIDTSPRDPFSMSSEIIISKYVMFGYVRIPGLIMNKIGSVLEKTSKGVIHYKGNNQFEANCLFKRLLGHCLPVKGQSTLRYPMAQVMAGLKANAGMLANGWFKIQVKARTPQNEEAFCVQIETKINVTK